MSLHDVLLAQSNYLLRREPRRPKQASLRRAVSAAYYALFHLLIHEASRVFVRDDDTIGMIARSYGHGDMLDVSRKFANGELPKKLHPLLATFNKVGRQPVVDRLKSVSKTFVRLQEARHEADYNLRKKFTRNEAEDLVDLTERAFSDWKQIRNDDLARIYLSCFLVSKSWDKDR
jgi:uncharacterized protein (UPF0332 family)